MVRILRGADSPLLSLAMVPDGSRLLVGGSDGLVRLLPSEGGEPLATWTVSGEWATSLGVSWNGKRAAVGASDGSVRFIDLP
jgi:WD40 repeat protein